MPNRHKHADVIIAWANGEEIEYYNHSLKIWTSVVSKGPCWCSNTEYRVKPKKKTAYKLYIETRDKLGVVATEEVITAALKVVIEAYKRGELDYE